MANLFNDFWTRMKVDYQEWRSEWIIKWNMRRRIKQVQQAIDRAKAYNAKDHRTYYILEDPLTRSVAALNSSDIKLLTRKGVFKRMTLFERLEKSIDIVTSNQQIRNQYKQVKQLKAQKDE